MRERRRNPQATEQEEADAWQASYEANRQKRINADEDALTRIAYLESPGKLN